DLNEIAVLGLTAVTPPRSGEGSLSDSPPRFGEGSGEGFSRGHLADYLPAGSCVVLVEPDDLRGQGRLFLDRSPDPVGLFQVNGVFEQLVKYPSVTVTAMPYPSVEATCHLQVESVERFSGNVAQVREELDAVAQSERVLIACQNDAECHRLGEVLAAGRLAQSHRLKLVTGHVRAGFRVVDAGVVVLGSQELFHREVLPTGETHPAAAPKRRIESRAIDSFLELSEGDLVVHVSHGIARYHGMHMLDKSGVRDQESGISVGSDSWPLIPDSAH